MSKATSDTITIPRAEYEALRALRERLEDLEDRIAAAQGIAEYRADPGGALPATMVERLFAGESPVRIWREHRGMKASELAAATSLTPAYISEIESGKKPGSLDSFRKIARALRL